MNRFLELQDDLSLLQRKRKAGVTKDGLPKAGSWTRMFTDSRPRGIRNNNPGNIRINKQNDWLGKVPEDQNTDKSFEQFTDYKYGVRALIILLRNYIHGGKDTLTKIFGAFAPPSENNTKSYIDFVAKRLKIGPHDIVSANRQTLRELVSAIAKMENGVEAVTDAQFDEGFAELPQALRDELDPQPAAKSLWSEDRWSFERSETRVKNLVVIEQEPASGDNGFLAEKAGKNPGALRVTSVKDFVDKTRAALASGEKIRRLTIYGHGSPGNVSLGDGQGWEAGKNISDNTWETEFKRLKGLFTPDGEIFLGGCNTGAEIAGSQKLKKIADMLDVTVMASTGKIFGNCTEQTGSRHQKGYPGTPELPPISSPSDDKKKEDMAKSHSFSIAEQAGSITGIYLHSARQPVRNAEEARFKFTQQAFLKEFMDGIDFAHPLNTRGISGKLSAQVFILKGKQAEEYVIFSDYDYFLKKGDWTRGYELRYPLKQKPLPPGRSSLQWQRRLLPRLLNSLR